MGTTPGLAEEVPGTRRGRPESLAAADTIGTYSAKVGTFGRYCETAARSAGVRPIRSSSISAAFTTACREASGCAAVMAASRRAVRGVRPQRLVHHREGVRGQRVLVG